MSDEFFGLVGSIRADAPDYNQMRVAGVGTYRFILSWSSAEPDRGGGLHIAAYDKVIGNLAARGIRPLPVVWNADREVTNSKKHRGQWHDFLSALVNRYKEGGVFWRMGPGSTPSPYHRICRCHTPPLPVEAWQIGNEPNLKKYVPRQMRNPRKYAKFVKLSDKAIRQNDPRAKTILAGLAGEATVRRHPSPGSVTPWKFLKKFYKVNGIKRAFDAAALDPYGPTLKDLEKLVARTRKTMKKHGDRRKPMWITEVGWGSANPKGRSPLNRGLNGQKKALKKSFKLFVHKRHKWRIQRVLWYTWRDPLRDQNICTFCGSAGLLRHDRSHKPAYNAYVRFTGGA